MKNILYSIFLILSFQLFGQNNSDSLLAIGHYKEAISILKNDTKPENLRKLVKIYSKIGNLNLAKKTLLTIPNKNIRDAINLARINYKIADKNKALKNLDSLYKEHPDNLLLGFFSR